MDTPQTEIVTLSAEETLMQQPDAFAYVAQAAREYAIGLSSQAWGGTVEDPSTWIWLLNWNSTTKAMIRDGLQQVHSGLAHFTDSPFTVAHVPFNLAALARCYTAPVTELIFATVKAEVDIDLFTEICNATVSAIERADGCCGGAWQYAAEDPRKMVLAIGWDSIKHHHGLLHTPSFKMISRPFRESVSEAKMFHVKFTHG